MQSPEQDLPTIIDHFRRLAAADRKAVLAHLPITERNRLAEILAGGSIQAPGPERFSSDLASRIDRLAEDQALTEAGRAALGRALARSRPLALATPVRSQSLAGIIAGWLGLGAGL